MLDLDPTQPLHIEGRGNLFSLRAGWPTNTDPIYSFSSLYADQGQCSGPYWDRIKSYGSYPELNDDTLRASNLGIIKSHVTTTVNYGRTTADNYQTIVMHEVAPSVYSTVPVEVLQLGTTIIDVPELDYLFHRTNYLLSRRAQYYADSSNRPIPSQDGECCIIDDVIAEKIRGQVGKKTRVINISKNVVTSKLVSPKSLFTATNWFFIASNQYRLDIDTMQMESICLIRPVRIGLKVNTVMKHLELIFQTTPVPNSALPAIPPLRIPATTVVPDSFPIDMFSPDLVRIFGRRLKYITPFDNTTTQHPKFGPEQFAVTQQWSDLVQTREYRLLNRLQHESIAIVKAAADVEAQCDNFKIQQQNIVEQIKSYEDEIVRMTQQRNAVQQQLDAVITKIQPAVDNRDNILKLVAAQKQAYLEKAATLPLPTKDFMANMESAGIRILSLTYKNARGGSMVVTSTTPTSFLQDPDVTLQAIHYMTLQPMPITVDSDKTPDLKVMAGPFEVKMENMGGTNNIKVEIRPAATWSIIGIGKQSTTDYALIWVPHTEPVKISLTNSATYRTAFQQWRTGCRGEIIGTLALAFQNRDIVSAVFAALAWLSNANSEDTWGKQYIFFPKPEEVDMTQLHAQMQADPLPTRNEFADVASELLNHL